jgi:radical SAM superfamily enzyme YgiQ (UPF0313 family)
MFIIISRNKMVLSISFADLTYTKQGFSNTSFPFGISLIAAYAKEKYDEEIDAEIFQYPDDFSKYLKNKLPKIACFSNYSWTLDMAHEFARKIKEKSPETITVFGGPNYPLENEEQEKFLKEHPSIDFYIRGEGEKAFVELLNGLKKFNFDLKKFKESKTKTGNVSYINDGKMVLGDMISRIDNLDEIPSPYQMGLLDKFFDDILVPIVQAVRGCPFTCTYCQEGQSYFCLIKRFSSKRVIEDLDYISKKVKVPNLIIADSNFGMYQEDIEICKEIAKIKKERGWPKYIEASVGKNKDTILESVRVLEGGITLGAPVQSTDEKVLDAIHRKNIFMEKIIEITKVGESFGGRSFSEVILGLPEDTKKAHFKSMFDMIDLGINVVRSHQFLMLPGSDTSTQESRKKYKMVTRFRLQPRCFGNYEIFDELVPCAEIDEFCITNSTMNYQDYLDCRKLDLSVEVFYNDSVTYELVNFLKQFAITPSSFVEMINQKISKTNLKEVYDNFIKENEDCLWDSEEKLKTHIKNTAMIDKYIKEGLRSNEQLKYRAIVFFQKMNEMHEITFNSAKELLKIKGIFNPEHEEYLNQLFEFSYARKKELMNLDIVERKKFDYDFIALLKNHFEGNPLDYKLKEKIEIEFYHNQEQKDLFKKYTQQFGSSINQIGTILSRSHTNKFYREVKKVN